FVFGVRTVLGRGWTKPGSKITSALPPGLTATTPAGGLKSVEPTTVTFWLPVTGVVTRPGPTCCCDRAGSDASNSEVSTAGRKRRHHALGGDASQNLRCRPELMRGPACCMFRVSIACMFWSIRRLLVRNFEFTTSLETIECFVDSECRSRGCGDVVRNSE